MADLGVPSRDRYALGFDTGALPTASTDVLVIGSGIAGLVAGLQASRLGSVTLVTKGELSETNTWYAQGGIAGAVGEADSVTLHLADTMAVGQGLCDPAVVEAVVAEAADALADLVDLGVAFDTTAEGAIALAREGGHSLPRVLHSGDATGAAIQNTLAAAVRASGAIRVVERAFLVDLLVHEGACAGALLLDTASGALSAVYAGAVVLATGGCGQVYRVTTNPLVASGDGIAAAWRAGAEIADMEFVQFHPTALDSDASPKFLITEALRGEGAYLLDCAERRFMPGVHPLAELAPRDIVSREIETVMQRCGRPNVWLDARHLGGEYLAKRFPTIWETCREAGYDLGRDLIPVAPAAHYMIGGVRVDVDGRSSLPGLYASGEVTASGLHGANRLASNSLLEGLVFSRRIVRVLADEVRPVVPVRIAAPGRERAAAAGQDVRGALQAIMSANVAVRRSAEGLSAALAGLAELAPGATPHPGDVRSLETFNLHTVATLIAGAASLRTESRGTHYREDRPARDDARWRAHVVWRRDAPPRLVSVGEPAPPDAPTGRDEAPGEG
ncbi:MAG: L-aspartate oxidase [Anaerosomatales bacterium]|nr:L-aspartate oxidase [Anaerosomatales bacterium]